MGVPQIWQLLTEASGEDIDRVLQMASVSRKVFSKFYDLQLGDKVSAVSAEPGDGSNVLCSLLSPHSSMSPVSTGEQLALEDRVNQPKN